MSKANFKRGNEVYVLSGDEKGKTGKVLRIDRKHERVYVEGLNIQKKTVRRSQDKPQGGIVDQEGPIHISNVMLAERYRSRRSGKES